MKRIITALLLFAAALLCACSYQNSDVEDSKIIMVSKSTDDDAKITSSPDSAVPTGQNPTIPHTRHITENKQLIKLLDEPLEHSAAQLDVEELLQYPELPTGCESVALTAVLRYHGFDLEKTFFAENYLSISDDAMYGYMGDPHDDDGAGVFPPALADDANAFFRDQRSDFTAVTIMGTELEDLYKLVDAGYPVLVWTTMFFTEPQLEDYGYFYEDEAYLWYNNEHCVALIGYDMDEGTVTLCDPLSGIVDCDAEEFRYIYDMIGQMSMTVIKEKSLE